MWGIRPVRALNALDWRITPTCVGNTNMLRPSAYGSEDHPHVCGEYSRLIACSRSALGITPTCVGNTHHFGLPSSGQRDHPHVCGEYVNARLNSQIMDGSPPRVWGIRVRAENISPNGRITPTCVGNTLRLLIKPYKNWDHPHVCGEYFNNWYCYSIA